MMDWRGQQLPTPWELSYCPFDRALAWRAAAAWVLLVVGSQAAPLVLLWAFVHHPVFMRLFLW